MSSNSHYDAIVFDILDTIYPWGPDKYSRALDALCDAISRRRPPITRDEVKARYIEIRTAYSADNLSRLVENDFQAYVLDLVRIWGGDDCEQLTEEALAAYNAAFAEALQLPDGTLDMFRRLSSKYKLGALSNYPTSGGIRTALERDGLAELLGATVVSAEIGFIKPHPAMFREVRDQLGCTPDRVLFVGDTWESDVVGAWLAGMPCVRVKPSASGIEQGQFFNGHIRRWLESRVDLDWQEARPLVELDSVVQLESWLRE
jgi:HAD superfamily hydrolase (TIGR01549 family)